MQQTLMSAIGIAQEEETNQNVIVAGAREVQDERETPNEIMARMIDHSENPKIDVEAIGGMSVRDSQDRTHHIQIS